jgi:hypothetical protein
MTWIRRFKNRKNRPYYEIDGVQIENLVQEYFPENELNYSRRWIDYNFEITALRVLRRTPYEFALDEIHFLFMTLTSFPEYYIDLDYLRQEMNWLRIFLNDNQIIYTLDWFLESDRPTYYFLKYLKAFKNNFFINNFWEGKIFSGFPCDPKFGEFYFSDQDNSKVVSGSEKRSYMWNKFVGFGNHRIFGHQWAKVKNGKLEPIIHPRFKSNLKRTGKYDI